MIPKIIRPYLTTHRCKKKHKPQIRYKMTVCKVTVCKIIQFARLQAISEKAKNGKRTNLKELLRLHKLLQGAPAESVDGGEKIGKTCLPPVGSPCLSNK